MFDRFRKKEVDFSSLPRIVFPEAQHPSILRAAVLAVSKGQCLPVLVGSKSDILSAADTLRVKLDNVVIRDPAADDSFEKFGNELYSLNQDSLDLTEAKELCFEPVYFSMLMARFKEVDGVVVGVASSSQNIFKPALRVFPEDARSISSFNVLSKGNFTVVFSDCSMNANPAPERLAEIALQTASSASLLSLNPKLALLSFSTNGASQHFDAMKVREASDLIKEKDPDLSVVGEVQFDVAIHPDIAKKKLEDGSVLGDANVLVFPDLDAGNIGLKIAQHFGGFEVLGPFAQGFPIPIGTLQEDCSSDEVFRTAHLVSLLGTKALNNEEPVENKVVVDEEDSEKEEVVEEYSSEEEDLKEEDLEDFEEETSIEDELFKKSN